ncbi:MAG: hypothetical protein AB1458_15685 [Bacteroidota bacterium]
MKKKVNKNREKLSSEEIAKRRDFGSLMKQFAAVKPVQKPFYKTWGFISGAAAVVVGTVATVVYMNMNSPASEQRQAETATQAAPQGDYTYNHSDSVKFVGKAPFINPPFKNLDKEFNTYKVDASKKTEISYPSGSKVIFPKDAFMDAAGNIVKGEVEVKYREFHDPVDFFLSGIPMTYDSAGKTYTFESAGMLELYAFQNGEVVRVNPSKRIDIELASRQKGKFNVYQLDTAGKNWVYKGVDKVKEPVKQDTKEMNKDTVLLASQITQQSTTLVYPDQLDSKGYVWPYDSLTAPVKKAKNEVQDVQNDIAKIEQTKPVQPKKVDPKRYTFNIDVDPKEFPELAVYKNLLFEIGPDKENSFWKPEMGKVTWDDALITEHKKGESYLLTLKKGKEKRKLIVYPVFEGANYDVAVNEYMKKLEEYNKVLGQKKEEEKKKQADYEAQVKKMKEEQKLQQQKMKEEQKKQQEMMKQQQQVMQQSNKVTRLFTIDGFGIWNCDTPRSFPKGAVVKATFTDQTGGELILPVIYQVDRIMNALFTYYGGAVIEQFRYNPQSGTQVWAVTLDGRLAVASESDFRNGPVSGSKSFKMKLFDANLNSESEIRKILNIGFYASN